MSPSSAAIPNWALPREATKADRRHDVPLSPQVVDLIRSLPRIEGEFVFNTKRRGDMPIIGFPLAKKRLDAIIAERCEKDETDPPAPWVIHDLRRSAASGMARLNVPPHILSRVLNHAAGAAEGITAIYNRHAYAEEQREALDTWGRHIEGVVSGKPSVANVVRLVASEKRG